MKIRLIAAFSLLIMFYNLYSSPDESMVFRGVYQGKDLFILNPMLEPGTKYCINNIYINGDKYDLELLTSAFRISLDYMGLKYGEAYEVVINYKDNCMPTLVNPEVLRPLSTFIVTDVRLGFNNQLIFSTTQESGKLNFIVEEYRWDRWVEAAEIAGKGGPSDNTYTVQVYPFSGENRYRIYQMDHLYNKNYSEEFVVEYKIDPVDILTNLRRVRREIEFTRHTKYAIINEFGEEVLSGYDKVIDVSDLSSGNYFLKYENDFEEFRKR